MNYNFSGNDILVYLVTLFVFIFGIVFLIKHFGFNQRNNVFTFRQPLLLLSMAISFLIVNIIFNWTTEMDAQDHIITDVWSTEEIEIEIPRTESEPKKLPPPPPVIELVPEEDIIEDAQPEFQPMDIDEDDAIQIPVEDLAKDPIPPLPISNKEDEDEEIRTFVEEMPLFPGCNDLPDMESRQSCSTKQLYEYIYKHLKYPELAQQTGIEGKVTLRFAVDKNGGISKVKIMRDIGGDCGNAAANAIKSMSNMNDKWTPGKQSGRPVSVWFTLPVVFKLTK